tara:strand:- start:1386 stop:1640 length:255 start_codon:yes stop_codon:yes gene_type:complete
MIKEIKYLIFLLIIFFFIFFTSKYYFSDINKKKSYRSLNNINKQINIYSKDLPKLEDDTKNIIEYVKNTQTKNKKKYHFWDLLN